MSAAPTMRTAIQRAPWTPKAKRLHEARLRADLTQREVAEQCGITAVQLSRYESGRDQPNAAMLELLCRAIGVSADHILGLSEGF